MKLGKKQESLNQTILKLNQAMAQPDYSSKVPFEVQVANVDKLKQTNGELDRLFAAMELLKTM